MAKILGVHVPDGIKNYIINADMRIAQRGTSFSAIANATYGLDRWIYIKSGSMVHTLSQDTDVPSVAQAGYLFQNSLRLNLTTPQNSIGSTDQTLIQQRIEGYNWTNLAQKAFTISFWVKATLPGVYCVGLNNGTDKCIPTEYTINGANTWEYKVVTIAASPAAGTWNYTTGTGIFLNFVVAAGSSFQGTNGIWQAGTSNATSNQVNGVTTGATDFRITGVMVNEGPIALPFRLFSDNSFQTELQACQRYFYKFFPAASNCAFIMGYAVAGSTGRGVHNFPVTLRAAVSPTVSAASDFQAVQPDGVVGTVNFIGQDFGLTYKSDIGFTTSASVFTTGQGLRLITANSNAFVQWNAEL